MCINKEKKKEQHDVPIKINREPANDQELRQNLQAADPQQHVQEQDNVTDRVAHTIWRRDPAAQPINIDIPDAEEVEDEKKAEAKDKMEVNVEAEENAEVNDAIEEGEMIEREIADNKARSEAEAYVKLVVNFTDKMKTMIKSGHYTMRELRMRVDCFNSVHRTLSDGRSPKNVSHLFKDQDKADYDDAIREFDHLLTVDRDKLIPDNPIENYLQRIDEREQNDEQNGAGELEQHILARYKNVDVDAGMRLDTGSLTDDQAKAVRVIDQWLLDAYIKKADTLADSFVFRLLNRPMRERLFAYYLIENGYEKNISELTVIVSQTRYTPDLKKIKKAGFDLSKLGEVYQNTCQAETFIDAMGKIETKKKENVQPDQPEGNQLFEHLNAVYDAIDTLVQLTKDFNDCSRIRLSRKKRLKSEVKGATEQFYTALSDCINAVFAGAKSPDTVDYEKGPDFYNKKEFFGDAMLSGSGAKAAVSLAAAIADHVPTKYAGNGIGGFFGMVGLVSTLVSTGIQIRRDPSGFSKLTGAAKTDAALDLSQKLLSQIHSMGSTCTGVTATYFKAVFDSVSAAAEEATEVTAEMANAVAEAGKTAAIAGTAAQVMAGAGIAVGLLTTANSAHKLKKISNEKTKRNSAAEKFKGLRDANPQPDKTAGYEDNILEIQKRISRRNGITAGCQMVSGICSIIGGALGAAGITLGAGIAGIVGISSLVAGSITTRIMKRTEYKKVVDDFLDMETIAKDRYDRVEEVTGKYPGWRERGKIREQLRNEMMALCGFTSVKAFYANIMRIYAAQIYTKIRPALEDPERELTPEESAYFDLAASLGLKIRRSEVEKKRLPTMQMIYQKLMG